MSRKFLENGRPIFTSGLDTANAIRAGLVLASKAHLPAPMLVTMELQYPRFIHSELMTHRVFSRNAASSRAIPTKEVRKQIWNHPAMPIHWGRNQSGMQANSTLGGYTSYAASKLWRGASKLACVIHLAMEKVGLHKQVANRILEPWMMMQVVVTATEWDNFLHLRDHPDAQPEIKELATCIRHVLYHAQHNAQNLAPGAWHTPYADVMGNDPRSIENALKLSASICAQSSFRKHDASMSTARRIWKKLTGGDTLHASPFEHQARAMNITRAKETARIPDGATHIDTRSRIWSANFCGWIQHRVLLENSLRMEKEHHAAC